MKVAPLTASTAAVCLASTSSWRTGAADPEIWTERGSAAPVLQQEVLAKQTAAVDAVSGATFTSASYMQSVQSALDKLGFKAADGSRATLQVPSGGGHGF